MIFSSNRSRAGSFLLLLLLLTLCGLHAFGQRQDDNFLKLWYKEPARTAEAALPVGNGRLGAMIYGDVEKEKIALNEATLWSGQPIDAASINPGAKNYLQPVRDVLFREDYKSADSLLHFMQGPYSESYLPLGRLWLDFGKAHSLSQFRRELDLQNAISKVVYVDNGTTYTREVFASFPDQVLVVKLKAEGIGRLNFTCGFNSQLRASQYTEEGLVKMRGWGPIHDEPSYRTHIKDPVIYDTINGMRFCALLKVLKTDGRQRGADTCLQISDAKEVVLLVSMATSFNGFERNPGVQGKDEQLLASSYLAKASLKDYEQLRTAHIKDYTKYFNRVSIDLGGRDNLLLSTPERVAQLKKGKKDNDLTALFYQYSRYLLISSSRPGGVPANLQGIWNEAVRPPWSSNHTVNINTQMNYWGAETGNLPEMHQPYFDLLAQLAKTGAATAKNYYNAGGWVCHHNTSIWAMTNPVGEGEGEPCWTTWPMGGAWLSTHLWEHFVFTKDKSFLKHQAYPILKGAAQFCLDFLVPDKKGFLVTAPSVSPENTYRTDKGYLGQTLYGATADIAIIRQVFTDYLNTVRVLQTDAPMRQKVQEALAKMYPYQVGEAGNLQEWYHDWEDKDPKHNHLSHLFGFYPGNTITPSQSPALADAVATTLKTRTNIAAAWGIAWRANVWARLHNGVQANDALNNLLQHRLQINMITSGSQVDGNFGGGAAIAEMLLQSHDGFIELLPALPADWNDGEVNGLVARGGFVVNIKWRSHQLSHVTVMSPHGGMCRVKYGSRQVSKQVKAGVVYADWGLAEVPGSNESSKK